MTSYPENWDGWKFVGGHASVHIYNIQTKGTELKLMLEPVLKGGQHWDTVNLSG